jgi:hypothetical protein
MQSVLQAITRPASKVDEAIAVLLRLATEASRSDEACARILFQAADFLEDVLFCAPQNASEQRVNDSEVAVNDNSVWPVLSFELEG